MTLLQAEIAPKPIIVPPELELLRGSTDLIVERSSGSYDRGWEFASNQQPHIDAAGQICVTLTKKQSSLFGLLTDSIQKEVLVQSLILLNPIVRPGIFGFGARRPPAPVARPTNFGIAKPAKPVKRAVALMTEKEMRDELECVAPHDAARYHALACLHGSSADLLCRAMEEPHKGLNRQQLQQVLFYSILVL